MSFEINETHDPQLRSFVSSANQDGADFPIQNLPFGVFSTSEDEKPRVGVAIGDFVLDVGASFRAGAFDPDDEGRVALEACVAETLNPLMALEPRFVKALRRTLSRALRADSAAKDRLVLIEMVESELHLPAIIGDYTDFYCSIHHANNVGSMLRPDNPLMPNYKHLPVGYHGRASSVVASGRPCHRPKGQTKAADAALPTFGPSQALDYELEVGFFVGPGNELGWPTPIDVCEQRIFGFCLLNDWSARDIQTWEYQPLGPFLAKNFQTQISPWIVTAEALAPFRVPAGQRPAGDPPLLPHLDSAANQAHGGLDLELEVFLTTEKSRCGRLAPAKLSRGFFRDLYWTPAQMLAHHVSNGCNLRPGDLLGSGTVSGPEKSNRGCLLELTWRGAEPLTLPWGETRKYLQDGDEVILRGRCAREGFVTISFGECRGVVLPALV